MDNPMFPMKICGYRKNYSLEAFQNKKHRQKDMQKTWQGCLLGIHNNAAHGWVYVHGNKSPTVELVFQGTSLALSSAHYYSAALAQAGIGDGHHAFILPIAEQIPAEDYDKLSVRIQHTQHVLPSNIFSDALEPTPEPSLPLDGHLDSIDHLTLRGWAWNASRPNEPVVLDMFIDGKLESRIECREYREDLMLYRKGNGCHGFGATLPLHVLDGKPHQLILRFSNSECVLHGCPVDIHVVAQLNEHIMQHARNVVEVAQQQSQTILQSIGKLLPPAISVPVQSEEVKQYARWIMHHDTLTDVDRRAISQHIMQMKNPPVISVLMPTYNTPEKFLREAIDSVLNQLYPHFELCIADDASPKPHVRDILEEYAAKDSRVKLKFRKANGHISEATNSALEIATGDYVGLFDHDDLLAEHALYMMADAILSTGAELLYCDEDKVDEKGVRYAPHFKPAWNPLYLYACNYVTHFTVVKRSRIVEVGGLHTRYNGSQDHELVLRLSHIIAHDKVQHIPFVLYHWRAFAESTALNTDAKSYAVDARLKAITCHARIIDKKAEIRLTKWGSCDVKWSVKGRPKVSILIPTRDAADMVARCVASIREKTDYAHYEILIIDNGSVEPETATLFEELKRHSNIRILPYDKPFNYSAINNFAVKHAKGSLLCLMNNDIEVVSPDWLSRMIALLQKDNVGAVGAKLLYPDGHIQHGGIIVGMGGVAGHYHRETPGYEPGYVLRASSDQYLSGVTAACMLTHKAVYEEVGGLDEAHLPIAFNDVDYCLKLRENGYLIAYSANSVLIHYESVSRGKEDTPAKKFRAHSEILTMQNRWREVLKHDPYFSPNLSLERDNLHAYTEKPRVKKPWMERKVTRVKSRNTEAA
jgi:GT2 family glycosyltransferase